MPLKMRLFKNQFNKSYMNCVLADAALSLSKFQFIFDPPKIT